MEFKTGQKYRIVDAGKMWDTTVFNNEGMNLIYGCTTYFEEGDILTVVDCPFESGICFYGRGGYSQTIATFYEDALSDYPISEVVKLITDDITDITDEQSDQSDDTISLCHIADVLEDAIENYNWHDDDVENFVVRVQECIKSLRKAGY